FFNLLKYGFVIGLMLNFSAVMAQEKTAPQSKNKPSATEKEEIKDSVKVSGGRQIVLLGAATGWVKSTTGKWISSLNRIPFDDNDYNNEYYEKFYIGTDNFKAIQVMEMKVDDKSYYALIHQYKKGYYKDVEKQEDWKYFTAADYYLIEKKEFKQFMKDSTGFSKPRTVSLRSYYTGNVPFTNPAQLPGRIAKDININLLTRHLYDTTVHTFFQFALKPVKTKTGTYMRFLPGIGYAKGDALPPEADYSLFSRQYYQTSMDYFKRFMAKLQ
ncbi:MAG: hypothetical protein ACXWEY_01445, partial [Bacteroidia bacterium]